MNPVIWIILVVMGALCGGALSSSERIIVGALGEQQVLGGSAQSVVTAALPWKRMALWTTLGLSVLMLAWMAFCLSTEMKA